MNLTGLGLWIVNYKSLGGTQKVIDTCKAHNIEWLAIRSGGADLSGQLDEKTVHDLIFGGVNVVSWNYTMPKYTDRIVAQVKALYDMGIQNHIIDAEIEYEGYAEEAKSLVEKLRTAVPHMKLAHSPLWYPSAHKGYPWKEFDELDAVLPQIYFTMLSPGHSAEWMLNKSNEDYEKLNLKQLRSPIGSSFHGTMMNGVQNGQPCTVADCEMFLYLCQETPNLPFWSLYSYDSMPAEIWALLAQRAAK